MTEKTDNNDPSTQIERRRQAMGYRVVDVSRLSGISTKRLYEIERGIEEGMQVDELERIGNALAFDPAILARGESLPDVNRGLRTPDELRRDLLLEYLEEVRLFLFEEITVPIEAKEVRAQFYPLTVSPLIDRELFSLVYAALDRNIISAGRAREILQTGVYWF